MGTSQRYGRRASDCSHAIGSVAIKSVPDAIIATDAKGIIIAFNPAAEQLFGYAADTMIGTDRLIEIMPPDIRATHTSSMKRHVETGTSSIIGKRVESVAITSDGLTLPVEIALTRDDSLGTPVFTAVIRDIRERRGLEKALEQARDQAWAASEAKSEFIAMLSHELRTPLSSMVTSAALLEAMDLSDEARDLIHVQRDAGEALLSLTSSILEVSRIEGGSETLDPELFDPVATARQALRIVEARAASSGVALIEDFAADVPSVVKGDLRRWRQTILNLLSNALKFTQHGSITLGLQVIPLRADNVILRVNITDTGIGMSEQVIERIFEPYEQADNKIRDTFGGSGLGLHIVRGLVEIMGGTLTVGSTPGVGSTFSFSVPVVKTKQLVAVESTEPTVEQLRILLVEDHDVNRRLVMKQLSARGHAMTGVGSASEAIDVVGREPFDLVLMDIGLPDRDGFSATRIIRANARERGLQAPPIVALTAGDSSEVRTAAQAAGMVGFLTKPLRIAAWERVIATVVGRRLDSGLPGNPTTHSGEVDFELLNELAEGVGWDSVADAAEVFAAEMHERCTAILAGIDAGDLATVAASVHTLKGVAGALGAVNFARDCQSIEDAAKSGSAVCSADVRELLDSGNQVAYMIAVYARSQEAAVPVH